ncbi:probable G-protein coupled receptor Mth-like 1 [Macrobrachium rosenbergii]|uniref:probable G-protein coupled receptor Mth-like 1 n=1 Tax=Macrobrachium rosenbergii TaxID=79674 RepID=UPI0034D5D1D8
MAVVCMQQDPCYELQRSLYPFLVIISSGFLGITLFVYVCIPDMHAKVHGKCVSSHVSALLIAFITLFIVHQFSQKVNTFGCKFMASVMQLSFLAAFFWLNVMCFDIWWTLRSMRLGPEPSEQSRLRFRLYSLYSWGCPFVIAVISVIIDSLPEDIEVIRPRFGETTCWFDGNEGSKSIWVYFYGIILVIIVVNILFFCHVMYILLAQQRTLLWRRLANKTGRVIASVTSSCYEDQASVPVWATAGTVGGSMQSSNDFNRFTADGEALSASNIPKIADVHTL